MLCWGRGVDAKTSCCFGPFNHLRCIPAKTTLYLLPVFAEGFQDALENQFGDSDEITRGLRIEFEIEENFDDLIYSSVGVSVDDGKIIMALHQRFLVEQQCVLCPLAHIAGS